MSLIDSLVRAVAVGVIIVILSATAGCSRTSGAPDNGGLVVDQDELSQIESSRNNLLYEPILAGSASDETAIDTYYIRDAMMKMGRADALPKLDVKKLQVLVKDKSLFDKIDASRAARELYFDRTDIRELKLIPTAADRLGAGLNMLEAVERQIQILLWLVRSNLFLRIVILPRRDARAAIWIGDHVALA